MAVWTSVSGDIKSGNGELAFLQGINFLGGDEIALCDYDQEYTILEFVVLCVPSKPWKGEASFGAKLDAYLILR